MVQRWTFKREGLCSIPDDGEIPSYTPSKMLYKPSSIPRCKALSFTSLNYSARMNTEGLFEAKQKTNSGEWVEMGNGEAENNG